MGQGKGVAVTPVIASSPLREAADLLGVSRPFLIELLGKQEIPFHLVGTHRRIYLEDLLRFREHRDRAAKGNPQQDGARGHEDGDYDQIYAATPIR